MQENSVMKNCPPQGTLRVLQRGEVQSVDEDSPFAELIAEERREAFELGKIEGEKSGYTLAKEESLAFVNLFQKLTIRLIEERKHLLEDLKGEVIEFALAAAERVIRRELGTPEKFVKLIDSFLLLASPTVSGEMVKIVLSSEDLVMLEGHLSKITYDKKEIKGIRFVPDSKLKRGDFRIETKSSLLNFMVTRELDDLRSKILKS